MKLTELMRIGPPEELGELEMEYITAWVTTAENVEQSVRNDRDQPSGKHAHLVAAGKLIGRGRKPVPPTNA